MPSPILARADALMQRRRLNADTDDVPVLTDAVDLPESDDDIPLLLDIEAIEPLLPMAEAVLPDTVPADTRELPGTTNDAAASPDPAASEAPDATPPVGAPLVDADIALEIARRVEQRLIAELPNLIATTVREYLAELHEHAGGTDAN